MRHVSMIFARFCAVLSLVSLVILGTAPASAQEVIEQFHSDIAIEPSGLIRVTETIRVYATGSQIRRGIFRDFPIRYRDDAGFFDQVPFRIRSVKRDGQDEPYFKERRGHYSRLYIGQEDVFLNRNQSYTYTITYETNRQLGFFPDDGVDELYWNVTGNFWSFPIQSASTTILLPAGATAIQMQAYTGYFGEDESDAEITDGTGQTVSLATTRVLNPGEGLTVAVGFTPGLVTQPSGIMQLVRGIWFNLGFITALLGTIAVFLYYLFFWKKVGIDPPRGTVIPLFKPPEGLSPGALSYIYYRGFGARMRGASRAFVSSLVSLAVKRKIDISEEGKDVELHLLDREEAALPSGERRIVSGLFYSDKEFFRMQRSSGVTLRSTISRYQRALREEHGERFYKQNAGYFAIGVLISIAALALSVVLYVPTEPEAVALVAFGLVSLFASVALSYGLSNVLGGSVPPTLLTMAGGSIMLVIGGGVLGLLGYVSTGFETPVQTILILCFLLVVFFNALFFQLLSAPTVAGQKMMEDISGFKMYLSVAEAERMNMAGAPDFNTDLFERYLPYAIGLGVEKPWSEALSSHLAKVGLNEQSYQPTFYHGSTFGTRGLTRSVSAMGTTIGSSVKSAMPVPKSSSSRSGGGGFSGGGGGGGGGGGW